MKKEHLGSYIHNFGTNRARDSLVENPGWSILEPFFNTLQNPTDLPKPTFGRENLKKTFGKIPNPMPRK